MGKRVTIITKDGKLTFGEINDDGLIEYIFMVNVRAKDPEERDKKLRAKIEQIINDDGETFFREFGV